MMKLAKHTTTGPRQYLRMRPRSALSSRYCERARMKASESLRQMLRCVT